MIPHVCRVKHDPENGSYGDCLRTSIACILNVEKPEDVPHFFVDGCDGETAHYRIVDYLKTRNLRPFYLFFDKSYPLEVILHTVGTTNPGIHYLLSGRTEENGHVVICRDDKVVHNTAWYKMPLIGAMGDSWTVTIIAADL